MISTLTTVRTAGIDDLPQLALLFDGYRVFYKKESDIKAANDFLSARIRRNESVIFVVEAEGKLVGFVQLYPVFSSTRLKSLWLLNDLFISPDARGNGISVKLIDRAKQLALDTGAVGLTLETAKSNEIGNVLYPRTGFTKDEEHNFYWWDC